MKAFALALVHLALLLPSARAQEEAAPGGGAGVTHVRIEGALDAGTLALVHRAVGVARANGDRLVIEIDSPGGEIQLMWRIAGAILDGIDGGVPVVGWVNDRAYSAAALLALACERLYVRPHAGIGSAQVVRIGVTGVVSGSPDEKLEEKQDSTVRSAFRGVAARHGRSPLLAEAMVDPDVSVLEVQVDGERRFVSDVEWDDLRQRADQRAEFVRTVVPAGELFNATGSEAVALGLADGVADSIEELVVKVSGRSVEPTWVVRKPSEELASFLYTFGWLFLLFGFLLGYVEFKVPGFGIPGILAVACIATFLFGRYLVGLADVPHILLIVAGIVLLAVELFVLPGTLWAGIAGVLCVLGGLAWSLAGPGFGLEQDLSRRIFLDEATLVVAVAFGAMVAMWGLSRFLPRAPVVRRFVLEVPEGARSFATAMPEAEGAYAAAARVGALGRALTALRPVGKVVLDGSPDLEYEARSSGPQLAPASRVRVVEVQASGRLVVEADGAD